ncbi:hypothetical protein BDZ97DRAFT_1753081 [Flammula alnicola]|nr:hypothetical protein BDZ97DRAFT_1753081 [Flammula alnicola]
MGDGIAVQHAPAHSGYRAVKVGGRRLSMSTKHKPQAHAESNTSQSANKEDDDAAAPDYPRPAPPTGDAPPHHGHHHNEEEAPPKKEKIEKKVQESAHWKAETTQPTRDVHGGNKGHGVGIRIAQPAGKAFGV